MIISRIASMKSIPKTCSECKLQGADGKCALMLDEHQNCPVTFDKELFDGATEKMEDGTTVIDVFKTGRRCLCPLKNVPLKEGDPGWPPTFEEIKACLEGV